VTDRDHFAAAALTGLLTQSAYYSDAAIKAYEHADAMLLARNGAAESRETVPVTEPMPKNKRAEVSAATHDAVPAAIVSTPDENSLHAASELGNPGAAGRYGEVTGSTQTAPPCVGCRSSIVALRSAEGLRTTRLTGFMLLGSAGRRRVQFFYDET
jgi:hypothetical protein